MLGGGTLNATAALYLSTDGGATFGSPVYSISSASSKFLGSATDHLLDDGRVYTFGGGTDGGSYRNLWRSTNGGLSGWTYLQTDPDGSTNGFVNDLLVIGDDTLYAAMNNGNIQKTTDEGATSWSTKTTVGSNATTLAMNSTDVSVAYAGGQGGLKRSANYGGSWSSKRTDPVKRARMNPRFPTSTDNLFVHATTSGTDYVYATHNGGTNWYDSTGNLPRPITDIFASATSGFLYAATEKGVYALNLAPVAPTGFSGTISGGRPSLTWNNNNQEADLASPKYEVYRYYFTCNLYCPAKQCGSGTPTLRATTNTTSYTDHNEPVMPCPGWGEHNGMVGYFVKAVDLGGNRSPESAHATFMRDGGEPYKRAGDQEITPVAYDLKANYPNPFNPVTTIQYDLPEDVNVRLAVVDVLGREVAVIIDEHQTAGYKSVLFDGGAYSSGLYFHKLTAGDFVAIRKMMLVK